MITPCGLKVWAKPVCAFVVRDDWGWWKGDMHARKNRLPLTTRTWIWITYMENILCNKRLSHRNWIVTLHYCDPCWRYRGETGGYSQIFFFVFCFGGELVCLALGGWILKRLSSAPLRILLGGRTLPENKQASATLCKESTESTPFPRWWV